MNVQDQERSNSDSNRARNFWKQKDQVAIQIKRGSGTSWTSWRQKETEFKVEEPHMKSPPHERKHKDEYPYNQRSRLSNVSQQGPNKTIHFFTT